MLLDHLDGILNYCRTKVPLGVVEAVNGNIKTLLRRGSRLQEPPLSAAEGTADGRDEDRICGFQESGMKCGVPSNSCGEPIFQKPFYIVDDAASFQWIYDRTGVGVAPGEIITILGKQLGPAQSASFQLNQQGQVPTTLEGSQVLIGEIPHRRYLCVRKSGFRDRPFQLRGWVRQPFCK